MAWYRRPHFGFETAESRENAAKGRREARREANRVGVYRKSQDRERRPIMRDFTAGIVSRDTVVDRRGRWAIRAVGAGVLAFALFATSCVAGRGFQRERVADSDASGLTDTVPGGGDSRTDGTVAPGDGATEPGHAPPGPGNDLYRGGGGPREPAEAPPFRAEDAPWQGTVSVRVPNPEVRRAIPHPVAGYETLDGRAGPGSRLRLYYWGGVDDCYALREVQVSEEAHRVVVAVFEGDAPGVGPETGCLAIALVHRRTPGPWEPKRTRRAFTTEAASGLSNGPVGLGRRYAQSRVTERCRPGQLPRAQSRIGRLH